MLPEATTGISACRPQFEKRCRSACLDANQRLLEPRATHWSVPASAGPRLLLGALGAPNSARVFENGPTRAPADVPAACGCANDYAQRKIRMYSPRPSRMHEWSCSRWPNGAPMMRRTPLVGECESASRCHANAKATCVPRSLCARRAGQSRATLQSVFGASGRYPPPATPGDQTQRGAQPNRSSSD